MPTMDGTRARMRLSWRDIRGRLELRIVKRVAAVIESDTEGLQLVLASDNAAAGADSRVFGPVAVDLVLGQVISLLR